MPKVPVYTLAWSPVTVAYELYQTRDREALRIVPDSPEWFAWLDQVSSFAFFGKSGHYTARKEAKQRGDRYWSGYLATGEQLTKRYLGKTADLTLARLEHIAGVLIPTINRGTTRETQLPPPLSPATGAEGEGGAARHPLLPQWFDPLTSLLSTKLHIPRPRPHLVLRSHLVIPKSYISYRQDIALPPGSFHPQMSSRLGTFKLVEMDGSHEVHFTRPAELVEKLIEASSE